MGEFSSKRNELLAEQVIRAMETRNMEGYFAKTKEDALKKALELIPEGSSISWGGSMSIKEIGLTEALHRGNYTVYDRDLCKSAEEKREIALKAFDCDFFLASTNAM